MADKFVEEALMAWMLLGKMLTVTQSLEKMSTVNEFVEEAPQVWIDREQTLRLGLLHHLRGVYLSLHFVAYHLRY